MKIKNFVTGLLAALCLTAVLCPAALAAPVEDDGSWDKIIADFLDKYEDRNKSCSITLGYRNLVTGEEHFYKGGEYMVTCSMYKVPLNMYFTEKVYNGEMDWDTEIGGVKYSDIGMVIISASGSAAATPAAIFFAASEADKLPLKLSGAAIIKGFPFLIYLTSARILSVFYHGTGNMSM